MSHDLILEEEGRGLLGLKEGEALKRREGGELVDILPISQFYLKNVLRPQHQVQDRVLSLLARG